MPIQSLTQHRLLTRSSQGRRLRASLRGLGTLALLALVAGLCVQAYRLCLVEQLQAHWQNYRTGDTAPGRNVWLPAYQVTIDAKPVAPGLTNLSGITYDYDHDRLLAITNQPMELLVLNKEGDLEARYPLVGFEDTEGLAYLGGNRVAIADEDQQRLDVVTLPAGAQPILASGAQAVTLALGLSHNNKGFEGVTYDPANDRLFAIKERDPQRLYSVSGMLRSIQGPLNLSVTDLSVWVERGRYGRDLSDGYYDPRTGHLLLLSDQSRNITELDDQGRFISIRSLRAGLGGLRQDAPQPEGLTMDNDGNLYVVSEPNLFYQFQKR